MSVIIEFLTALKDLIIEYFKSRLFHVLVVFFVLFSLLINQLFTLQIKEGEEHSENFTYTSEKTLTIDSIRGRIYDCNGKILAYNEISYNVTFGNSTLLTDKADELGVTENSLKNEILYKTISILEKNGDKLSTDFPIVFKNGEYQFNGGSVTINNFIKDVYAKNSYDELTDEQKNKTAEEIVNYLKFGNGKTKNFDISTKYSNEMALKILACRYKLWLNRYQQYVPVNIAYGVSEASKASLTEYHDELYGIEIDVSSKRVYNDAEYFAHIIGYIGSISNEELSEYNSNPDLVDKYTSSDLVGKTGLEKYFESDLRGTDGQQTMYVDNLGKVLEITSETPATAGNDIYLTIDSDLQKYCYDMLEQEIAAILLENITPNAYAPDDNKNNEIPITDVYFALFNNNYLVMEKMAEDNASELEKHIYSLFSNKQETTLIRLNELLVSDRTNLKDLSKEYRSYIEYICEMLSNNNVYLSGSVDKTKTEFTDFVNDESSLYDFLHFLISEEVIDISPITTSKTYLDNDEIYEILCEYIINQLKNDSEFDKLMIKTMIKSSEITGSDVVNLIYDQGVLSREGDSEYSDFSAGKYGAYEFMRRKLKNLDITPAMLALDPCSGSVVITDVNTGRVKALVSYPSYDNNYLTNSIDADYYYKLLNDKTNPLYNRACNQRTAPGSTFKIISSITGVQEGAINLDTVIFDKGVFTKVYTEPQCWIYSSKLKAGSHGTIGISQAIDDSCNYFFYEVGFRLATMNGTYDDDVGINALSKYATLFGLSDKSGVELDEISPHISDFDSVTSAIGQGTHNYTPTQLARYVTTIANSGTCYDLTLLDSVTDYEGNLVRSGQTEVHSNVVIDQSLWDTVHYGMRRVVSDHLSGNYLLNHLNVNIAGKTGTAQQSKTRPNHALFISYAPYENPDTSVTVVIQNGYSSGNAAELAGFIYAYMYDKEKLSNQTLAGDTQVSD